jgi:hypothetical protein
MTMNNLPHSPCIVDRGTLIHKRDMHRILADLGRVYYQDIVDGQVCRQGEGYVMEVYEDPCLATMVANRTLYLNVCSFDYLSLSVDHAVQLDLVQDNRVLRLIPLSDPLSDQKESIADMKALQAAVADALAAGWDP